MISNEEAFIKAAVAAQQKAEQLGRDLSPEEYEKYTVWYVRTIQNPYLYELSQEPSF